MKFDLTDLRMFLSAADRGSLTAAAADNHVVVAAVSARLKRLEQALGLQLFERTGRGIVVTGAGEVLAKHARNVLQAARQTEIELEDLAERRNGRVRLLSNTNMLAEHLPTALGTFLAANPEISVDVQDRPSLEVVEMLRNGEADIGVAAASADMTGLERYPFVPDRLVLVVPADCALTDPIDFSRILDFGIVALQERAALSQFLRRRAFELGRRVQMRMRMDGFEGICRMVECGAGIAIVPETAALRYMTLMNIRILVIADGWSKRELYLCTKAEANRPVYTAKLLDHLKRYAQRFLSSGIQP